MTLKKFVINAVSLLLITALFSLLVTVIVTDYIERRDAAVAAELIEKELISSGLISEKIIIERELSHLSDKEADRHPTLTFLFREPKRVIYDSIRPMMNIFGMIATVAISHDSMPGDSGNLSVEQYRALLETGYGDAILYDGSLELSAYLQNMTQRCLTLGIAMPTVLYVCGDVDDSTVWLFEYDEAGDPIYTPELQAVLDEYGIENVVQETYETKLVAYENFYSPLTYCEALGFNAVNESVGRLAAGSLYEVVKRKAAVVYSVNFEFENHHGGFYGEYDSTLSAGDGTTTDDFARMLGAISEYGDTIIVTDVAGVAEYRREYNENLELDEETDRRLEELRQRLDEIKLAIQAIKDKYR